MADSTKITVTTTWTQFPASTDFLFQNIDRHKVIFIVIAASTPAAGTEPGFVLKPDQTAARIGPGNHWHRVDAGTADAMFVDADA